MSRMNSDRRPIAYEFCKKRDGEKCVVCKRYPVKKVQDKSREVTRLYVDHKDNNNNNNPEDGSNWQLLCPSHNAKKNPRGKQRHSKFSSHLRLKESLTHTSASTHERAETIARSKWQTTAQLDVSAKADPLVRAYVNSLLSHVDRIEKSELACAAAEHCMLKGVQLSEQTAARYIRKYCNNINGFLESIMVEDTVYIRKRRDLSQ
jgi:hypothetical protein